MRIVIGGSKTLVRVHLVLGVGTTKVVFGGFVEAIFVILEEVSEL